MALNLNTNVASLKVQDNLNRASNSVTTTMERLSSGLRINSAKDDAAGMQISSRLTTQIRGMTQAIRNAGDAISIAQSTEKAMHQTTEKLQRMRTLTVQAQNGSNGPQDRAALNAEFQENLAEITRASKSVRFGTDMNLMDGSAGVLTFQVGPNAGANEKISLSLTQDFSSEALFAATKSVAAVPSDIGAASAGGGGGAAAGGGTASGGAAAGGGASGGTVVAPSVPAPATTTGSKAIVAGAYTPLAIDGTGNRITEDPALVTALADSKTALKAAEEKLALDPAEKTAQDAEKAARADLEAKQKAMDDYATENKALINQAITENLDNTLKAIDAALEKINSARADIGAKQNRLTSTIENLTSMLQSNTAARGRIQDVDYAADTAELTKNQILQQASTAILAQANQLPAAVLKLLQ